MMREEFERLVCHTIDAYEYGVIEEVYMDLDSIKSKQHIASIYLRHGMNGIYALRRLVRGESWNDADKTRCYKMLAEKEMRLPSRYHKIILWYNLTTGELYDCTFQALLRYALESRCWIWIPYTLTDRPMKRKLNSVLCNIATRHPRLWRPCSSIARKFCSEVVYDYD